MRIVTLVLFAFVILTAVTPANADGLRWVPNSALQLQILSREGTTFLVEVTNQTDDVVRFDAIGLYFLPDSPGEEPQRLGVVSSGRILTTGGHWADARGVVEVAPHAPVRLQLTSYCLDEHRSSPSTTKYYLAGNRMPAPLLTALAGAAQTLANSGVSEPRDSSFTPTQRAVWKIREAMPVTLLGEARSPSVVPAHPPK